MTLDPKTARITWDENGQPISNQFDDVYFSKNSGIDETRFVFLKHNDLPERWKDLPPGAVFTIAETGFGTGLNFLAAWQAWRDHAPANATLHFISVEKFPLSRDDLARALSLWPELNDLASALLRQYPPVDAAGFHRLNFGSVQLTLIYDDALAGFSQLLPIVQPGPNVAVQECGFGPYSGKGLVDAWFLDGFAPAKNPDLWTPELFQLLARLSRPGATFATFTAAGIVRRGLLAEGFQVNKVPGYGTKREMLHGMIADTQAAKPVEGKHDFSWHLVETKGTPPKHVAVIGAGMAGCHTAWALAQKGVQVTLIEQAEPGAGASGNPMGVLYSRLSHTTGRLSDFNLTAYLYACRFYHQEGFFQSVGDSCGVLQLPENPEHETQLRQIAELMLQSPEIARWLEPEEASNIAGVPLSKGALYLPQAGWLSPPQLCRALANHPNIRLLTGTRVQEIRQSTNGWELLGDTDEVISACEAAVIACAYSSSQFAQSMHLPLKKIRGQVSLAPATQTSATLKTVLCGEGYIAPAVDGQHCMGASFVLRTEETEPSWQEHEGNLHNVAELSPALNGLVVEDLHQARVSFRCTTPDYLPITGPLADADTMAERFARLRQNAKANVDQPGGYYPGLFINVGHGSRGLAYTPLCAELLACLITAQPLPLPREQILSLHPARFLIRDLGRNRI